MGFRSQARLKSSQHRRSVSRQRSGNIQHQTWEGFAVANTFAIGRVYFIFAFGQNKPIESDFSSAPSQVFFYTVTSVGAEFIVQVNGTAAGSDFGDEFWRTGQIAVLIEPRSAAVIRQDPHGGIGLEDIVCVQ